MNYFTNLFRALAHWDIVNCPKYRLKSEGVEENSAFWDDVADSDFVILVCLDDLEIGDSFRVVLFWASDVADDLVAVSVVLVAVGEGCLGVCVSEVV